MGFKSIIRKCVSILTVGAIMAASVPFGMGSTVFAASDAVVDTSTQYQYIRGFGGMNHPEWIGDLTAAQRKTAFGNGDNELGLTILRVFVNPDSNQWYRAVDTAKYASSQGATVFATPWEPPSSLAESGGSNGKLHLPKANYGAYAKHLNDFGTYMKNQGVNLYSISVQNEPDYASEWTYWSSDETTDFLANYGDKITSTRVMSPESFQYSPEGASWILGGADGGKKYYNKILNNSKAFANCDVFGTHFYGTTKDWMDFPALEGCGKEIWMTEVYVPNSEADSNSRWPESLKVSENIHNGLVTGNMSAYVWWYIRRSYGPMNEDGTISKRGYCMAQYSKFVRPGYKRIAITENPAANVNLSAFKGDNKIVIVAVNSSTTGYAQHFTLNNVNVSNIDRYRTSANENLAKTSALEFNADGFYAQLPAESVSTFVIDVAKEEVKPDSNGYYTHDTFEDSVSDWEARGSSTVGLSGRTPYEGTNALLVSDRTSAWHGAQKALTPEKGFVPGKAYSFSTCVKYIDGPATEKFSLTLQYKDSGGTTQYKNIDNKTAVRGEYVQLANTNYTIPEGATDVYLVIESASGTMNFYFDEAIGAVSGTKVNGPAPLSFILGDVDYDGKINVYDLYLARKGIKSGFADNAASVAADTDQNGTVDKNDIIQLQNYLLGRIKAFTKA